MTFDATETSGDSFSSGFRSSWLADMEEKMEVARGEELVEGMPRRWGEPRGLLSGAVPLVRRRTERVCCTLAALEVPI
jgi:hypothetical protein